MSFGRIRRTFAAVSAALVLTLGATPAWSTDEHDVPSADSTSPPMFDLFVLRPVGIVAIGIGTALFIAPVAPLTLISRPSDIGKPFRKLVVDPVRYVVADPLGEH